MADQKIFPESLSNGAQQNGSGRLFYPSQNDAENEEFSFHEIVEVLFKNKWTILVCFVVVLTGVAFYTLQMDPEYEAKSKVLVNTQQSNMQLAELLGLEQFASRNVANEIEIVKSRKIATRVAEQMIDIERVPGTDQILSMLSDGRVGTEEYKLEVAQRLQYYINVQPVSRGVDIIEIVATSTVPEEAALISTTWAQEYYEHNRTASRARMTASKDFLNGIKDQFSTRLQETEDQLTEFFNQERLVVPDEEAEQLLEQIALLQRQEHQAQLQRGTAQAAIRELELEIGNIEPGLADQLSSGDNQFIEGLSTEIAKLDIEINKKYARNPELEQDPSGSRELLNELSERNRLQTQLDERAQRLVQDQAGSLGGSGQTGLGMLTTLRKQLMEKKIEARGAEVRSNMLTQQIRRYERQLGDIPGKEVLLNRLQRSRETTESLYIALVEKLQEVQIAEQSELGYVEIVEEAIVPSEPVRPQVRFNLLLASICGLALGLGLAFIRNAVDNKVRRPEDLRKRGHSVVGIVPDMERIIRTDFNGQERVVVDNHEYSTRLISLLNPLSPIAEGYRRVRTNVQFAHPDGDVSTIMITSPGPGEGKTVTALNLAITIAQAGRRTLYIDADLRRPQGHRMMGLAREPGLVDLLFDMLPDTIEQFATELDSYLYVIPAGRDVPNPAEVLGSRKMKNFIDRWRQEFDVILIDTPPTLLVADALILAAESDVTLVVCSAGQTNWQSVDRCAEALKDVGAEVIGTLLNRFDAKAAYGGYKYGYGYGYEYGYGNYYYYGPTPTGKRSSRVSRSV